MSDIPAEHEESGRGGFRWKRWVVSATVVCCLLLAMWLLPRKSEVADVRPIEVLADGYASSKSCQKCHQQEYNSWHASYHRTMTQTVSTETAPDVLKNTTVTVEGRDYRFEQQGDEFWVEMHDPTETNDKEDPSIIKRRVVLMTGSHHMHLFWYAKGPGRTLAVVPLVYLIDDQRWIPRSSALLRPRESTADSETGRWNSTCCRCHSTHPRPRPRPNSQWDTHVAEFGIACEACHGPGAAHAAKHRKQPADGQHDSIVNPKNLVGRRTSQVCAQCHAIHLSRSMSFEHGPRFRPGQDFAETGFRIQRFKDSKPGEESGFFWPDGMVRVSGREYNGLIESPCFQRGKLSCLSCHSLHGSKAHASPKDWADDQLHAGMRGNQACLQCHKQMADNVPAHTHHAAESSGSLCMNCHMPHTTFGLLKGIRSHQIDSPRVATGVETGRITACNQCHLDRSLQWTADSLAKWYGQPKPELDEDRRTKAVSVLHSLKGDAGQRALAAWSFGWQPARNVSGTDWTVPYLLTLMNDDYDAVRLVAFRSLRSLPGYKSFVFDPFAEPAGRAGIIKKAIDAWNRRNQNRRGPPRPNLLLDANGQLDRKELKRLLKDRDNRRVKLLE